MLLPPDIYAPILAAPFIPLHSSIFYQRYPLFCQKSLRFQIFLLLLLPESDKQRATVSVALPADTKKPPIETGAGTFYGGNL